MLMQNKHVYVAIFMLASVGFNVCANEQQTVIDCEHNELLALGQPGHHLSQPLHYDGHMRPKVTNQAIAAVRFQRQLLDHINDVCNAALADDQTAYMYMLQTYLPLRARYVSSIYFATGSAQSSDLNIAVIRQQVGQSDSGSTQLLIVGSADNVGEEQSNQSLSLARARFLASKVNSDGYKSVLVPLSGKKQAGRLRGNQPKYRRADLYLINVEYQPGKTGSG
ncbi:hypothetical protein FHU10_1825 [Serratia fonticola]|jgi:hypothetical protein|uniref:OmpA-like domain-containing protein n=1 Tax=Serratia fonticola TaxID=47917 RepID=A0A542BHY3_SERFO|nr:hypothetical protein [Serratia fonticola]TQI78179.1 hypothetical protein FHU09_0626 [Serratia fonticola]TQI94823.1 hypothetical protein FHU11_0166 [Serratia fonticola]TVZ69321.1 hypothetical protein FHU10_1825 [Serratia fonticola]